MLNVYLTALLMAHLVAAEPAAWSDCSHTGAPPGSSRCSSLAVRAIEPATYKANPSLGKGGAVFKDSAHFRVYGASDADAKLTLKHLEAAHSCYVNTIGWRTPALSWTSTTDEVWYKTNIYSRQASEMPGRLGLIKSDPAKGLAWLEIVSSSLTNPRTTVHEYGHTLSVAEKNWIYQTRTGAWWEPVAEYIADTYISTSTCSAAKSAQGLSATPGESIIAIDSLISRSYMVLVDATPGTGNYYQSWPFIAYLNNNPDRFKGLGDKTLINLFRKYTVGSNDTPLHALKKLLIGTDVTVQQIVGRYWARMAYVDIGHAKAHDAFVASRKVIQYNNLDASGAVLKARAPRYMGANINPLKVKGSTIDVVITSGGAYTATLVVSRKGKVSYTDIVKGKGRVAVAAGDEVSLVVANTPELVQYDPFKVPAELNVGLQYKVQVTGASL